MATRMDGWGGLREDVAQSVHNLLVAEDSQRIARVPFIRYGQSGMTDRSYRVGYLMFHALYRQVGAQVFDKIIGGLYQDHRNDGVTFEELVRRAEQESPRDLTRFFQDWVSTTRWYAQLRRGVHPEEIGAGRPRVPRPGRDNEERGGS
jgi:aminopeptidase N